MITAEKLNEKMMACAVQIMTPHPLICCRPQHQYYNSIKALVYHIDSHAHKCFMLQLKANIQIKLVVLVYEEVHKLRQ
jgi:hypothetical protein